MAGMRTWHGKRNGRKREMPGIEPGIEPGMGTWQEWRCSRNGDMQTSLENGRTESEDMAEMGIWQKWGHCRNGDMACT